MHSSPGYLRVGYATKVGFRGPDVGDFDPTLLLRVFSAVFMHGV
jgi:hypothetical protein